MKKSTQIIIGILFIVATASSLAGIQIIDNNISNLTRNGNFLVALGAFLQCINSFAVVCIAALFFPFLYKRSKFTAIIYLASRIIESVILLIATIFPLMIGYGKLEGELADILNFAYKQSFQISMLSLSLGSLVFCVWLLKHLHMPKMLSILGIVGYCCLFVSSVIALFPTAISIGAYLYIPGGIFEVMFPIYLIIRPLKFKSNDAKSLLTACVDMLQ